MTLIEYLPTLDDDALTSIWRDMNAWRWPAVLPESYKPEWWDGLPHIHLSHGDILERRYGFSGPIRDYITSRGVGRMMRAA